MTVIDLDWMKEYVDTPAGSSPQKIAFALTKMGFEEEKLSPAITGPLVVGHVLECDPEMHKGHEIHFCKIDIGKKVEEIVCGAPNIAKGSWVAVALPGAVLAGGFLILPQPKYGHTSNGMCCSFRELGWKGSTQDGIILLDDLGEKGEIKPGEDAIELLKIKGWKLDVEITPNRGYALSYRGMARELHCAWGGAYRDPALSPALPSLPRLKEGQIEVEEGMEELYCLFAARAKGEEISKDPEDQIFRRLALSDVITKTQAQAAASFATLEIGCPVEVMDAGKISFPLQVRKGKAGEKAKILGKEVECEGRIVVCQKNDGKVLSLLGMGAPSGLEAEKGCKEALFLSYSLDPSYASRLSQSLKISTDSSYRLERGVDSRACKPALSRALSLLKGCSFETLLSLEKPWEERVIKVETKKAESLLGEEIPEGKMVKELQEAGCEVKSEEGKLFVKIPSWRYDLQEAVDVEGEIGRLVGYDLIETSLPKNRAMAASSPLKKVEQKVQDAFAYAGLNEVMSYPFVGEKDFALLEESTEDLKLMKIANPLYDSKPFMRTDLLSTLLFTCSSNVRHGLEGVKIFETGRVFLASGKSWFSEKSPRGERLSDEKLAAIESSLPSQPLHAAAVLSGKGFKNNWQKERDLLDYRNGLEVLNRLEERLRLTFEIKQPAPSIASGFNSSLLHPGRSCAVYLKGKLIGIAGEINPRTIKNLGLFDHSCALEIDLEALASVPKEAFRASSPSLYPSVKQDFSFETGSKMSCGELEECIRKGAGETLEDLELFDVYKEEGENPSLTFSVRLRSKEKTLDSQDITKIRDSIISIAQAAGARLKGNC
ncbi:MAG: phenylalanine--tRNA ligase subunit beta [Aeriscardovia sp.]|nr:phenylalanine--tRNA ligase subunit beta [Aeriscardovia sp.]